MVLVSTGDADSDSFPRFGIDIQGPSVTMRGSFAGTTTKLIPAHINVTFSEPVVSFSNSSLVITGAFAPADSVVKLDDTTYQISLFPFRMLEATLVTISLNAGTVVDPSGNSNAAAINAFVFTLGRVLREGEAL